MAGVLVTAVLESGLPRGLKPIAMALASYANADGGSIRPSRRRLAWGLGLTQRQVSRSIGRLVAAGVLRRIRGPAPGLATEYRLEVAALPRRPAFKRRFDLAPGESEQGGH